MKQFYIETDRLTTRNRTLRFVYSETDAGTVSFLKVVDPITKEEVTLEEMKKESSPDVILNIATAYLGNYERIYLP